MCGVVVVVLLLSRLGLAVADCTLSSTQLTGTAFEFAGYDGTCNQATPIIKQLGVSYTAPELRVVANTTVTFTLAFNAFALYPFGLTLSNVTDGVRNFSGSALGLLGAADGSCVFPPYADRASTDNNNTIAFNTTTNSLGDFIFTQCNITWKVPQPSNTPIYYFVVASAESSTPRRIYIDAPSVSSSSSSSSSTGSSSPSGSPSPSSGSSSSSTGTGTGTGTGSGSSSSSTGTDTAIGSGSSSSSSPSSGATGTSSSTPAAAPSSTSSSKPTGTSSSSTGTPNSAATARVSVSGAGVVAVMSMFAAWL